MDHVGFLHQSKFKHNKLRLTIIVAFALTIFLETRTCTVSNEHVAVLKARTLI